MQESPGRRRQQLVTKKVRLCRQSLRDLRYWRTLTRGDGTELHQLPPQMTIHSDAADVGHEGTLGYDTVAGSPGLWDGQGFWTTEERKQSISLRKLRVVRLLLHRHFDGYLSETRVRRLLLHEDNQAAVAILRAMVSASRPMMVKLRKPEVPIRVLGVKIEAKWLPSAVNRFADSFSRTWDPSDAKATYELLASIQGEFHFDHIVFANRPMGEVYQARQKYIATQMRKQWGDGRSRLWNPPFDLLPLVVRKI